MLNLLQLLLLLPSIKPANMCCLLSFYRIILSKEVFPFVTFINLFMVVIVSKCSETKDVNETWNFR